ncbi:hypothetical protein EDD63_11228 [Breznakia blatticola]|uniref:Uncharacterized protein n=1 Tax=Breznakia blatticola TaxID=1754012 RepID=A0A4R7ZS23_9FIRM|nr:hypothetical protein [Breznakia blatticola]TDW20562.1 hypothetical protein EDD63_11228 [Breznakia blatticola]
MKYLKVKNVLLICVALVLTCVLYVFQMPTNALSDTSEQKESTAQVHDENPPTIIGPNAYELVVDEEFSLRNLKLRAYDSKKQPLLLDVIENDVNTSVPGNYKVIVEAKNKSGKISRKTIEIIVKAKEVEEKHDHAKPEPVQQEIPVEIAQETLTPVQPPLDRTNLYVRGWKIEAPDMNVSDDTVRKYVNEIMQLPNQYNNSSLHTITIDLSIAYPYLGMGYSDGRIWLNGQNHYPTTVLHEATHIYDFGTNLSQTAEFQQIFNQEKGSLPVRYSGNMNDNAYEWLANAVVYYYNDPQTLASNAPLTHQYVYRNLIAS